MKIYSPTKILRLTQGFYDNKTTIYASYGMKGHGGYDYACPTGTPLFWNCDMPGVIYKIFTLPNSGKCLSVIVNDGTIYRFGFAHLQKYACKVGDIVMPGELIAWTDNTGAGSTGPHLHCDYYKEFQNGKDSYVDMNHDNGFFGAIAIRGEKPGDLGVYEDKFILETLDNKSLIREFLIAKLKYMIY